MKDYGDGHNEMRRFGEYLSFISCFNLIDEDMQGKANEYKELIDDLALNEYA